MIGTGSACRGVFAAAVALKFEASDKLRHADPLNKYLLDYSVGTA